jgi:hypothetical protein
MKIPRRILERVRGPLLAAAVAGCSSGPTAGPLASNGPSPNAPPPDGPVALEPADPVDYDAIREAERLERTDRALAATETRRTDRIEAAEAERQTGELQRVLSGVGDDPFRIGVGGRWPHGVNPACGRG